MLHSGPRIVHEAGLLLLPTFEKPRSILGVERVNVKFGDPRLSLLKLRFGVSPISMFADGSIVFRAKFRTEFLSPLFLNVHPQRNAHRKHDDDDDQHDRIEIGLTHWWRSSNCGEGGSREASGQHCSRCRSKESFPCGASWAGFGGFGYPSCTQYYGDANHRAIA